MDTTLSTCVLSLICALASHLSWMSDDAVSKRQSDEMRPFIPTPNYSCALPLCTEGSQHLQRQSQVIEYSRLCVQFLSVSITYYYRVVDSRRCYFIELMMVSVAIPTVLAATLQGAAR